MVYSPVNQWTFPINPNFYFYPQQQVISSITNSNPAIISTLNPHGYQTGYNVRIVFPYTSKNVFGMEQIEGLTGTITVLSSTAFSININTKSFDIFTQGTVEKAQVVPISQYVNGDLLDFQQGNPVNPSTLLNVVVFQSPGLQAGGPCSTSQT